ncbi:DUF4221 family protein [Algoriphagus sediminis]|uniref:DUF4221 family protein n=1 Tax=Algoriphagus sediminis TaxID=3057113 RepID=A0ABT7YBK5_9BACT|nr:DUF4221 family protein [Algoriphagus sediminis]MDN3203888.1 DUF4221 family protein [Algoriphagus sediminis]
MRTFLALILGILLFSSCATREEDQSFENVLDELIVNIDTVVVDVGEEIFIPGAYNYPEISADQKTLFFYYEGENPEIHEIELEDFSLKGRYTLKTDGPNRVPEYLINANLLADDKFALIGYGVQGIYSKEGEKLSELNLESRNWKGLPDIENLDFKRRMFIIDDGNKGVSIPGVFMGGTQGLASFDFQNDSVKMFDIPAMDIANNFRVVFMQGNGATISGDQVWLDKVNNSFIVYCQSTSDIYQYLPQLDSLRLVSFDHKLVPNKRSGSIKADVNSHEERRALGREINKLISFTKFYWDDSREMYFRFASENTRFNEEGSLGSDIYLFAYDQDLNLIGEKLLKMDRYPFRAFIKDGYLYAYTVVGEFPAFAKYSFVF